MYASLRTVIVVGGSPPASRLDALSGATLMLWVAAPFRQLQGHLGLLRSNIDTT